jgi:hypothetical protein
MNDVMAIAKKLSFKREQRACGATGLLNGFVENRAEAWSGDDA